MPARDAAPRPPGGPLIAALCGAALLIGTALPAGTAAAGAPEPQSAAPPAAAPPAGGAGHLNPHAGELSVDEAVEQALRNAGAARRGRLEVSRSDAAYRSARAERFPSLSLSLSGSYLTHPDETLELGAGSITTIEQGRLVDEDAGLQGPNNGDPIEIPSEPIPIPPDDLTIELDLPHTVYRATATLAQPLFTWGQISRSIDAARLEREVRRAQLREIKVELRREVREVYFGAVFGREAEALLVEMERVLAQIVSDRRTRYEQGTVTREAVLEAEAQQAELRAGLAETREAVEDAREALAFYTRGGRPDPEWLSSAFRTKVPSFSEPELVEQARAASPRRDALSLRRRQAEAAAAAERGDRPLFPQLGLEVSIEADTDKFPLLEDQWRDRSDYNVIISIGSDVTLFDAGRRRWSIAEAEERAEIARTGLEELEHSLSLEVRRAVGSLRRAEAAVARRKTEHAYAAERYRNARIAYESEAITREQERLARLSELEAEAALLEARYELERALTSLEYTIAGAL